jgi:hypothetical protein
MADHAATLGRLKQHFGRHVDEGVLESVLLVCDGDYNQAVTFLTAQPGDQYVVQAGAHNANEEVIPPDYLAQARRFSKPAAESVTSVSPLRNLIMDTRELFLGTERDAPAADHWKSVKYSAKNRVVPETPGDVATTSSAPNVTVTIETAAPMAAPMAVETPTPESLSELDKVRFPVYLTSLLMMLNRSIEISKGSRPRVLACLWAAGHYDLVEHLLNRHSATFSLPEILRGLQILDSRRLQRSITKKLLRLETQGCKNRKKMGMLRGQINDLKAELLPTGSLSGALASRIRKWCGTISEENLAFFALNMPRQPWKDLADLIHLKPTDFKLGWFLPTMFTGVAPEDSILAKVGDNQLALDGSNLVEFLTTHKVEVPFSYLRSKLTAVPVGARPLIAAYTPLDTLIWYHEELEDEAAHVASNRLIELLTAGELPKFNYGKLMERLMYFKALKTDLGKAIFELLVPIAERRLTSMSLDLEPGVVVAGDASYSMDVAVRTATVIGAVISLLADEARLKFFHVSLFDPPIQPQTIREVVHVAEQVKADNMTAPGCLIEPYLREKKVVKCFVIVTDEVENVKHGVEYFPELFARYYRDVYPAEVVFVSFLENVNRKGRMVSALESMGFSPIQFRLDGRRPDLSKLDSLLGVISLRSQTWYSEIERIANEFTQSADIKKLLNNVGEDQANL